MGLKSTFGGGYFCIDLIEGGFNFLFILRFEPVRPISFLQDKSRQNSKASL